MQIRVAGPTAGRLRLVEQRRRPRSLPLLPDRLRAEEARLALEIRRPAPGAAARRERRLRLGVAVTIVVRLPARHPLARGAVRTASAPPPATPWRSPPAVRRRVAPGFERSLGPDPPVQRRASARSASLSGAPPVEARSIASACLYMPRRGAGPSRNARGRRRRPRRHSSQRDRPSGHRCAPAPPPLRRPSRRRPGRPTQRRRLVPRAQAATGGVVGVVGRQARVARIQLLEQASPRRPTCTGSPSRAPAGTARPGALPTPAGILAAAPGSPSRRWPSPLGGTPPTACAPVRFWKNGSSQAAIERDAPAFRDEDGATGPRRGATPRRHRRARRRRAGRRRAEARWRAPEGKTRGNPSPTQGTTVWRPLQKRRPAAIDLPRSSRVGRSSPGGASTIPDAAFAGGRGRAATPGCGRSASTCTAPDRRRRRCRSRPGPRRRAATAMPTLIVTGMCFPS